MTIDINSINSSTIRTNDGSKAEKTNQGVPQNDAEHQKVSKDTVKLTEQGQLLQKLQDKIAESAVDNSEKISAIKQALADGTYKVDANKVAEKLLQLDEHMLKTEK